MNEEEREAQIRTLLHSGYTRMGATLIVDAGAFEETLSFEDRLRRTNMSISKATTIQCAEIMVKRLGVRDAHKLVDDFLSIKGNASFLDSMLAVHRYLLKNHPIE